MLQVVTGDPREIADELVTNAARRPRHLYRRRRHRQGDRGEGGLSAHRARAGRQRPAHRDGGCRSGRGLHARGAGLVQELRPALHGGQAHARAPERRGAFHRPRRREDAAWSYGDPFDPANDMGTVIDEAAARLFEARVDEAVAQGARLLAGNRRDGALYSPTVLDHVRPEMTLVREETFGPVSPIMTFADIDEAIRDLERHRLRAVLGGVHQPPRLHHALRRRARRRHRQRARGARLPARAHALRRHQGFGPRLQGRRAGSDEELHEPEDLFAALGN